MKYEMKISLWLGLLISLSVFQEIRLGAGITRIVIHVVFTAICFFAFLPMLNQVLRVNMRRANIARLLFFCMVFAIPGEFARHLVPPEASLDGLSDWAVVTKTQWDNFSIQSDVIGAILVYGVFRYLAGRKPENASTENAHLV